MSETQRLAKTESFREIMGRLYLSNPRSDKRSRRAKLSAEYRRQLVLAHWPEIVSTAVSNHAAPHNFSFDTLFISAEPVWANQLEYLKRELIDKINAYTCGETVKDIRFTAWKDPEPEIPDFPTMPVVSENIAEYYSLAHDDLIVPGENDREQAKAIVDRFMGTANVPLREKAEKSLATELRARKISPKKNLGQCPLCGRPTASADGYCSACIVKKHDEFRSRIRSKLTACPWAGYGEVNSFIKCRPEEYNRIRQELLREQAERVTYRKDTDTPGTYTLEEYVLVMLYKSLPLERLNDNIMSKSLFELRYDLKGGPFPPSRIKKKNIHLSKSQAVD